MHFTIFLSLEPYLAQWLVHESGGTMPIHIKRGSAESDILELMLKKQPKMTPGYRPQLVAEEGQVQIQLPNFKYKNVRFYNYLDEAGKARLYQCIRNRFLVQLWRDLMTVGRVTKRSDLSILEWMEQHGIEQNDRNWNTIAKILQRKRRLYAPLKQKAQKKK